jgi:hypothetical protein
MPLCLKYPVFVEAPPFAAWFQKAVAPSQTSFPHPLSFIFPRSYQRPKLLPLPSGPALLICRGQKGLFRSYQTLPHKHNCHRGLVQLGVYLLAPRAT